MPLKQLIENIGPSFGDQWTPAMIRGVAKEYAREVLNKIQANPNKFIDVEIDEKKKITTSLKANAWKNFGL